MGAVHDDGNARRTIFDVEALHAPGEPRGQARFAVEERRADRLAEAPAHALAAQLAEDGGCEREIDLFDRGRGVEAGALHPRAKFVGSGLHDAPRFVVGIERRDEHGSGLEYADLFPRDRRARAPQDFRVLERDVGDDRDLALDDVGRIETTAQADFDHRPLDGRIAKDEEGRGGEKVEPGRVGRGRAGCARGLIGVERLVEARARVGSSTSWP